MAEKAPTLAEVERESAQDTIRAVMAEAGAETVTKETPPAAEETPAKETDAEAKARQDRDERGRFKAKAGEEAPAQAADKVEQPAAVEGAVPAETVATETAPIEPPTEWKADEQQQFRGLTRPAQEFVLAKYNALRDAEQRVAQTAGKYAPLESLLAPRKAALARDGLDEVGYLQYLDRLSQSAAQDPVGFVRWFAQQRGIKPEHLFQQQPPQQGQASSADPYIAQVNHQLGEFKNYIETQRRAQAEAAQQALATEILTFGSAKDANNRPVRPYFEEVRPLMGALLKSEQASDLQSAYDMACRAHPEVSRKIDLAAKAKADQDRQAEQRKKAEAARKAGSSISGTPGDRSAPAPSGDIREDLRRQFAERGMI